MAALRLEAGLTQAEVAKRIDTAVNNYQRIEHGLQNATIRTLVKRECDWRSDGRVVRARRRRAGSAAG